MWTYQFLFGRPIKNETFFSFCEWTFGVRIDRAKEGKVKHLNNTIAQVYNFEMTSGICFLLRVLYCFLGIVTYSLLASVSLCRIGVDLKGRETFGSRTFSILVFRKSVFLSESACSQSS